MSLSQTSQKSPSHPSSSSHSQTQSLRGHRTHVSPLSIVVTSPRVFFLFLCILLSNLWVAWARDEPPSPKDEGEDTESMRHGPERRPSDVASFQSSGPTDPQYGSRWWAFTLPRSRDMGGSSSSRLKSEKKGLKGRSMSWMTSKERDLEISPKSPHQPKDWDLRISLPPPTQHPFTISHNRTPGWDSPWTPRVPHSLYRPPSHPLLGDGAFGRKDTDDDDHEHGSIWRKRKRRFRAFILSNPYVPLVSRFHGADALSFNDSVALPCYQHYIHDCCSCCRHSNSTLRTAP